jgi:hypothetical protein
VNFFKTGLMSLSIILLLSACATTDKQKAMNDREKRIKEMRAKAKKIRDSFAKVSPKDTIEGRKFATLHAENFFKAVKDKDYDAFCKSQKMSKKGFDQWCKKVMKRYGSLKSQKYLDSISNPLIIRYIWKWSFSRKTKGQNIPREVLFIVDIAKNKKTNKYLLVGATWK